MLETVFFDTLNASKSGLFLHWGTYGSGKSIAAENAALRLQSECGGAVIMLHGYVFVCHQKTGAWLRQSVGLPPKSTAAFGLFEQSDDPHSGVWTTSTSWCATPAL